MYDCFFLPRMSTANLKLWSFLLTHFIQIKAIGFYFQIPVILRAVLMHRKVCSTGEHGHSTHCIYFLSYLEVVFKKTKKKLARILLAGPKINHARIRLAGPELTMMFRDDISYQTDANMWSETCKGYFWRYFSGIDLFSGDVWDGKNLVLTEQCHWESSCAKHVLLD